MSRDLRLVREDLANRVQLMQIRFEARTGLELRVTCGLRTLDEQARLYRQGRTLAEITAKADRLRAAGFSVPAEILLQVGPQTGPRVTGAAPGESLHQWGAAVDVVPIRDGAAVWDDWSEEGAALWLAVGEEAEAAGLAWGGRWRSPDMPHVELIGFDWRSLMEERLKDGRVRGLGMTA